MGAVSVTGEIESAIRECIPADHKPVVVYASAWPFLRQMRMSGPAALEDLVTCTLGALGERLVLMPTFTRGYTDGVCDLDRQPSITGAMTEAFRMRPGVRRTLSGFFSFAVAGGHDAAVLDGTAEHAWGAGSCYEWMHVRDVHFLMLGTHPTHCSFLHRAEWLVRESIPFRYDKSFTGRLVREGVSREVTETLFVRRLDPPVVMDFTPLEPCLRDAGMIQRSVAGASLATYDAAAALACVVEALRRDPWVIVRNRRDYAR